jgi:hypothetical protein
LFQPSGLVRVAKLVVDRDSGPFEGICLHRDGQRG